jgi:predicted DNA-binding protein
MSYMGTGALKATVTIRLPEELVARLKARAHQVGATPSEIIRSVLERALADSEIEDGPTAYQRSRQWVGSIRSTAVPPGRAAREALEDWEPDRRG